jgi:uncharacterized RDD family membrane protein YckC
MPYIGVGRRAGALLLDTVVYAGLAALAGLVFGPPFTMENRTLYYSGGGYTRSFFVKVHLAAVIAGLVWVVYMTLAEWKAGASLGKRLVRIKVVRADGQPMDLGAAATRNALRVVDGVLFYLVGAILVWTSPLRQRLGDRAAKTLVVRADAVPIPWQQAPYPMQAPYPVQGPHQPYPSPYPPHVPPSPPRPDQGEAPGTGPAS